MHVLLVEDEDAIRSALARGLARDGTTIDAAASLTEARAKAAARRPDAIVTDLKLPDGLGLDLAQELGVPFVQMSGYGTFDDAVRALRLGCVDFFTKPVALRDLRAALERIAQRGGSTAMTTLFDPEHAALATLIGDRLEQRALRCTTQRWDSDAGATYQQLASSSTSLRYRQVLAELLRVVPCGKLVINHDTRRWIVWLDTGDLIPDGRDFADVRLHLARLSRRVWWLADGGVVVELPGDITSASSASTLTEPRPGSVRWQGAWQLDELLWPQPLIDSALIDLSAIAAVGTWIYEWFRAHPGQAVVDARPDVRRQLEDAGVPILWRDPRASGVTPQERRDLLGE